MITEGLSHTHINIYIHTHTFSVLDELREVESNVISLSFRTGITESVTGCVGGVGRT